MIRTTLAVLLIATAAGCDVGANGAPSPSERAEQSDSAPASADHAVAGSAADGSAADGAVDSIKPPAATPPTIKPEAAKTEPAKTVDKSFDDLKFEMAVGDPFRRELLTDEIEALGGRTIRIRGYILPPPQKRGLKSFVLVRDNMECCFGPGAALYDCILIEMAPGKTAEFSTRPVAVEGEFAIEVFPGPDDTPLAIYRMTGQSVK